MYQPSPQHTGRTALTFGAATGIGAGIVQSALIVFMVNAQNTPMPYNISVFVLPISLLLWIILFMLVGVIAARRTGKVGSGTLTGLWAGLIGGGITSAAIFVEVLASMQYYYGFSGTLALYLTLVIFLCLLMLGLGTGLGSLGGLIGQSFSQVKSTIFVQNRQSDPPQEFPLVVNRRSDPPQEFPE